MCGIVGFIHSNESIDILRNMNNVQAYRGPDDDGLYHDKNTGLHLGHNRLSIQDLSSNGHQPFVSNCKNYVVVFNGEIYNFKSLKTKLEKLGHEFISNSDTEVILYSFKEWGIKCIEDFIGMFAFTIFDKANNKLYLVRDRTGIKPLYFYKDKKNFMFSSEIKSFHENPNFKKEQNLDVLPYFFQFGYIPSPHCIFKNCFKLEAGHYLELRFEDLEYTISKYWDVNDFYLKEKFSKKEDEIIQDLEILLEDAINLRMISDVPVGLFLSGGYDSSLVAAILSKKLKKNINTYTVGFYDSKYNEAEHAKEVSRYLETNHKEYYVKDSDMLELIEDLPIFFDEPFGDSSALPTIIVSRLAKEDVTVALSADGGDETFCGYSKYFFLNKFKDIHFNRPRSLFLRILLRLFNASFAEKINNILPKHLRQTNFVNKYTKFKRAIFSETLEEMFINASSYIDKADVSKFLTLNQNKELFTKWKMLKEVDFLEMMMALDYKLFMNDDVLTKTDRSTMSVSLEGREPLLDHRLIEYLARVPLENKYKKNEGKYLLRKILYKYIPKEIIDKPKSGFTLPLDKWLRNELKPIVKKYISLDQLDENIFNIKEVLDIKDRFFNGESLENHVWLILNYQMWKKKWLD